MFKSAHSSYDKGAAKTINKYLALSKTKSVDILAPFALLT